MKKILLVLAVAAMVVSSCGTKTNAQKDEATQETPAVEASTEAPAEKACCSKDSTKADAACCDKDSTAVDCEKKCGDKAACTDKKECTEQKEDKA